MTLVENAPHQQLTYKIIGLAMEAHNELGPGHREADYHDARQSNSSRLNLILRMSQMC